MALHINRPGKILANVAAALAVVTSAVALLLLYRLATPVPWLAVCVGLLVLTLSTLLIAFFRMTPGAAYRRERAAHIAETQRLTAASDHAFTAASLTPAKPR